MSRGKKRVFRHLKSLILLISSVILIMIGVFALWIATLKIPDLSSFQSRKVTESTKIYDRTGTVLLYDTGTNVKSTSVPLSSMSPYLQKGTIAIEDSNFYNNIGIEPSSIFRAVIANFLSGNYSQGASTITQQVIKNSLLTQDKTVTRKIKEWILAIKITRLMSKDQILEIYLNESPYGGTIYGVEQASQTFFGKPASEITLAQSAYLAAIPKAPTYYSPYGKNKKALDARQKLVLDRMLSLGMITKEDYDLAQKEKVEFLTKNSENIRAPHFVMYIRDYLIQKYGEDSASVGGLRVKTTLDFDMQQKAEEVIKKFAPSIEENYKASNASMVAIDPKTGDILTMVGSKDYFSKTIDGNYNTALAKRQPGSTFKPFVYSTLFKKGYTPETVLFDVRTEFSSYCTPEGKPINPNDDPEKVCYSPREFDSIYPGPMTIRKALGQSRNIPAVKALYLAGIPQSIQTARDLGITSLNDPNKYGLTMVLGGGEVSLLEMTGAYATFANDGIRNPTRSILEITDSKGNVLESASLYPSRSLDSQIARQINSILADNSVRINSLKPIADSVGRKVTIKTGTTNDYRDVWAIGYTPNIVVGAWAGNNDNTPMSQNIAGLIISPLWGAFMSQVAKNYPPEDFLPPPTPRTDTKPVIRGIWQGGISYNIDTISGKVATEYTPKETLKEVVFNDVHNILHWVDKNNPNGPIPTDPTKDTQYPYWEYAVRKWFDEWKVANPGFRETTNFEIPKETDNVHVPDKFPQVKIVSPEQNVSIDPNQQLSIKIRISGPNQPKKVEVYLNDKYVLTKESDPLNISFVPADVGNLSPVNTLSVTVYDSVYNKGQDSLSFQIR
jgi:penicillin-binding protein 1C